MADESYEVAVHALSVDGEGIGRLEDGRVIFIAGALPGDTVRTTPTSTRARVLTGALSDLIVPSPERVAAGCDLLRCGGCPLRSASVALQAEHKGRRLVETLRRIGKVTVTLGEPVQTFVPAWGYRHRVRWHAHFRSSSPETPEEGAWQLGYHEHGSQRLVPLSTCPVIWPELERMGRQLVSSLAGLPRAADIKSVEMAYSRRDQRAAARLVAQGPMAALRSHEGWLQTTGLSGIELVASDARLVWGNLELRYDHAHADTFALRYEPGLFTQAFCEANDALVAQVMSYVVPRSGLKVLELHAGIGNFSVPLARAGAQVVAVEQMRRSAQLLTRNAQAAGVSVEVHARRDEDMLDRLDGSVEVLLLDPARTGARALAEHIAQLAPDKRPQRIVYVSCDPATLARDVGILAGGGYKVIELRGLDLFPQTPHVEAVALLVPH